MSNTPDTAYVQVGRMVYGPCKSYAEAARLSNGDAGGVVVDHVPPDCILVPVSKLNPISTLSIEECAEFTRLEHIIQDGLPDFIAVGSALIAIRDQRLYRASYASFEQYVEKRWNISRARAYQLITAGLVSTQVDIQNERQARELNRIDPEMRPVAWQVAKQIGAKIAPDQPVPVRAVKAAVSVLSTSNVTGGYVDTGDGEMDALEAAVTQELHEVTKRQQQHVRQSIEKQNGHAQDDRYEGTVQVVGTDDRRGFVTVCFPDLCRVIGAGETVYLIAYVPKIEGVIKPA